MAIPAAAAAQAREPVGGFVADVHGVTTSLPTSEGWTPPSLVSTSLVPGRGFGAAAGLHVIFGPGRHTRLGLGLVGLTAQGEATGTGGAPTVTTRLTVVAPPVAVNFGHRDGWSYISGGVGPRRCDAQKPRAARPIPTGSGSVYHYGGGARWFLTRHVAVSFDLRLVALSSRAGRGRPGGAAATRHFAFCAGAVAALAVAACRLVEWRH